MAKMTQCKTCGKEIASSAKVCTNCGAKNKKPFYKRAWFIVLVFIIIVSAIGGSGGNSSKESTSSSVSSNSTSTQSTTPKKEKFEIVGDLNFTSDEFATYISGVIKNNSGKDCSYVQITFNLYDKEGNQVGTAFANVNNLEKDGTWKFKAMGVDTDGQVASYKLAEITGY